MSSMSILILYLVFFGFDFMFQNLLTLLNMKELKKNSVAVPGAFRDHIDYETYLKSSEYTRTKSIFTIMGKS